jgi:TPR repeat protein
VRDDVIASTGDQEVFQDSSLPGKDYFFRLPVEVPLARAEAVPVPADEAAWKRIDHSADPADFVMFAKLFPDSPHRLQADLSQKELICDGLAGDWFDLDRSPNVPTVRIQNIKTEAAAVACTAATNSEPRNRRLLFELGRSLFAEKNYTEALPLFERSADLGSAAAMSILAGAYAFGTGVDVDMTKTAVLAKKAAELGSLHAIAGLGLMYLIGGYGVDKDEKKALELFKKGAAGGDGYSTAILSSCYADPDKFNLVCPRDIDKAVSLFFQAIRLPISLDFMMGGDAASDTVALPSGDSSNDEAFRRGIEQFLVEQGYLAGEADGKDSPAAEAALAAYAKAKRGQ